MNSEIDFKKEPSSTRKKITLKKCLCICKCCFCPNLKWIRCCPSCRIKSRGNIQTSLKPL